MRKSQPVTRSAATHLKPLVIPSKANLGGENTSTILAVNARFWRLGFLAGATDSRLDLPPLVCGPFAHLSRGQRVRVVRPEDK